MAKKIKLENESELKTLLSSNLEAIEENLVFIATEVAAHEQRRMDILAQDEDKALVIIELKIYAKANAIMQLLDYGDFAYRNYYNLFARYSNLERKKDFNPNMDIRLVIVASDFDPVISRVLNHIDWEIGIFRYQAFFNADGKKDIVCLPVETPPLPEYGIERERTVQGFLDYITSDPARNAAEEALEYCKTLGAIHIEPKKTHIALKTPLGKNFAKIRPRRTFFHLEHRKRQDGSWYECKIDKPEDFDAESEEDLKNSYEWLSNPEN